MGFMFSYTTIAALLFAASACGSPVGSDGNANHKFTCAKEKYRVMFYNVENFFDFSDDSLKADEAFTPAGDMHWTPERFNVKLKNIYKVVIALGGWQPPDIIGMCEIENRYVLDELINQTPLVKYPYKVIHEESPDRRGIDVALLFNGNTVQYLDSKQYRIYKPGLVTRNILYFKALLNRDTCHFLVNHWPSRSAGQLETEADRLTAADLLKSITDSLFGINRTADIIIMGDFNDEPADLSLSIHLKALPYKGNLVPTRLYNLSTVPKSGDFRGTLKYQGQWNLFDQIIVSGNLLNPSNGIHADPRGYVIFGESFLLTPDEQYNGFKPFRTYNGFHYQGGFSDHLPVYIDLLIY
jgi:predicted extracellular nuclease